MDKQELEEKVTTGLARFAAAKRLFEAFFSHPEFLYKDSNFGPGFIFSQEWFEFESRRLEKTKYANIGLEELAWLHAQVQRPLLYDHRCIAKTFDDWIQFLFWNEMLEFRRN